MVIDGKKIAQEIIEKLRRPKGVGAPITASGLKSQPRPDKIFAAILVGDDKISDNFLKQKEKVAKELGIDFRIYKPEHTNPCVLGRAHTKSMCSGFTQDELRDEVGKIALLKRVGGVIVQLPLPSHINKHYILNVIPREKDVDVLGERALGAFYAGRNPVLPPAVGVVDEILQTTNYKLQTTSVAVIGAGFLIGKPIALWLMDKVKELSVFEKGSDLSDLKNYDLVISGVGKVDLINPEMLKEGAGIIDFGYSIDENGKIHGDLDIEKLQTTNYKLQTNWYTPTPGGTGPILVAKLFENFYKLNAE